MTATADEFKSLGNKAFSAGNYSESIEHFSKAIELDSSNHVLFSNRSAAYASIKQFDLALNDANKTVQLNPSWAKGYSRLGAAYHGANNLTEALNAYKKGLEIDPNNSLLQKGLDDVQMAMDNGGSASKDPFAGLLNQDIWSKIANNPKLSPLLADQEFCNKIKLMIANPQMAMSMIQDQKIMMTLLTLMGINMTQSGDDPNIMTMDPQQTPARTPPPPPPVEEIVMDEDEKARFEQANKIADVKEQGNLAYKSRDFNMALDLYQQAYTLSEEKEVPILNNMAAVYFEQGLYEKCIEQCQLAIEKGREFRADFKVLARAYSRIGNAYVKMDMLEKAVEFYNKSLTEHRTPDTLTRLHDTEKMIETQRKLAYQDVGKADEARERGNEFFKVQKYAEAVQEYTESIKRNDADPRPYSNRATCYHKLGAIPDAIKDCDTCIKLDPKFVKAYIRKASCYMLTKEHSKALEALELAKTADVDRKHDSEIQQMIQRTYSTMYTVDESDGTQTREERAKKAMQDPEVQSILADPVMNQILQQMQSDPKATQDHMKNPQVAAKIRKLISAGVIGTR